MYELLYKKNIAISVVNALGTVIIGILAILYFNESRYIGRIIGLIGPMLLMGIFFYIRIFRFVSIEKIKKHLLTSRANCRKILIIAALKKT